MKIPFSTKVRVAVHRWQQLPGWWPLYSALLAVGVAGYLAVRLVFGSGAEPTSSPRPTPVVVSTSTPGSSSTSSSASSSTSQTTSSGTSTSEAGETVVLSNREGASVSVPKAAFTTALDAARVSLGDPNATYAGATVLSLSDGRMLLSVNMDTRSGVRSTQVTLIRDGSAWRVI